ncbi:MAG TPA: cupin domain-containing protein [Solirubrobacterales bacterium]|nr:cupin domain-containing protein [Solirubrobacterales bacterium]
MAKWPGFGEQRWYTDALGCTQISFSWRSMPAGTGGRGSYGHRHPGIEEVYLVLSGTATFKIDDDVLEVGPLTAIKVDADSYRSLHNDTDGEVQLVAISARSDGETERQDNFWD